MPTDWPAITEPFSTSPSITARRKRAGPEMLDLQLCRLLVEFPGQESVAGLRLVAQEALGAFIDQAAHRDHREALIQLHRGQRVAGGGADEGLLEALVRDGFLGGGEAGAELRAGGTHFQIGEDGLAAADPAGDEHRHLADMRQDLLRQDVERHRADMPAGLGALDHQCVGAAADQSLCQHQRRGEGDQLGAAVLHRAHRAARRDAAGQHDMAHLRRQADLDQVVELRVHGDQVHAEGLRRSAPGCRRFRQPAGPDSSSRRRSRRTRRRWRSRRPGGAR